jgi:hypothetical protein
MPPRAYPGAYLGPLPIERILGVATSLDNGRRSSRKILRAVVARLLGLKA